MQLQMVEQQGQLRDALNETLKEEVQRLRSATGQWMHSGVGGQQVPVNPHVVHNFTAQQIQQLKQSQAAFNGHPFFQQHQGCVDSFPSGISGSMQGHSGNYEEAFGKPEVPTASLSQESSTSF